jgi:hypothetical protein
MPQIIPIYIPTYISDQNYNPSRVLPRLFYYNGLIDCETYYIESGSLTQSGMVIAQSKFPYFDNYNVAVSYGALPSSSLFTEYWDTYISLLYNPKTRLLTAKAIIPLADYVKMELNDIVNFRGNYYHLRAINNYSLKTGDCELQLLGPIIPDTFSRLQPSPEPPAPPPSGAFAEVSWSFTESGADGNFKIFRNGSPVVTATANSSGNLRVSGSDAIAPELYPVSWTAGVTSSLFTNGGTTISSVATTDTTLTGSFTAQTGSIYYITGSVVFNSASGCCTPTITTASLNGANLEIFFTTGSGCDACTYTTIQSSTDNSTWGGNNTGGCTSPRSITAPTQSTYYRIQVGCASTTSSFSTSYYYVSASAPSTATLYWSFSEVAGGQGIYDLYINAVSVETRNSTANGTYTVNVGDVITVGCNADQCTGGGSTYTNIVVSGEITDAACQNNGSIPSYVSPGYTVVSGDIGTNLYMDLQVQCDGGCL